MAIKRKGVTRGDLVRAIKSLDRAVEVMHMRVSTIETVVDKYIVMKGDSDRLKKLFEDENKENEESNTEK